MGSKPGTRKTTNPLLESIRSEPIKRRVSARSRWYERMEAQRPEEFANLREIVEDFQRGGETAKKLRTVQNLHEWLQSKDVFPQPISVQSFRQWLWELEANG